MESGRIGAKRGEPAMRWSAPDPERRGNLKDKVAGHLRALILSGGIRPGAKIDQDGLAEELRLSKLPVREALIELASEGLVDNVPRRGAFVSALTPEDVRDHFLVYGRVAALAAERAAVTMSDEALAQLNHRLAEMGGTDDPGELARLNHEFHRLINLAGGSRRLSSVLGLLARNVPFDFFRFAPGWTDHAHEDHIRIAQAIGRRDPAVAGATMNDHLAAAGTLLVTLLRDSGFWEPARARPRRARPMSDAEIAVAYRERLTTSHTQARTLEELRSAALKHVHTHDSAWLVISLAADVPGTLALRRGLDRDYTAWLNRATTEQLPSLVRDPVGASPGFRSLLVSDGAAPAAPPHRLWGELRIDGSGVLAYGYPAHAAPSMDHDGTLPTPPTTRVEISDEHLVADVVNVLAILAEHAHVRSRATGEAAIEAQLLGGDEAPMLLTEDRGDSAGSMAGTRLLHEPTGVSRHVAAVADIATRPAERVRTARGLIADLMSAFGQPEPDQVSERGELVLTALHPDRVRQVRAWAQRNDVPVVPEYPGH